MPSDAFITVMHAHFHVIPRRDGDAASKKSGYEAGSRPAGLLNKLQLLILWREDDGRRGRRSGKPRYYSQDRP